MAKENVKKINGVIASIFAHTGHLTKDEAKEMSGLDDREFDEVYAKAAKVVKKITSHENVEERYDKFAEHLYEEIEVFVKKFGPFDMGL
ncbi:MAG: hypothetical protein PWQ57_381 [Desulfovibrionales bacterium]|jgi:hypothetical protein|nr:hypothetical protein [Desulfovibrionales bacterium]